MFTVPESSGGDQTGPLRPLHVNGLWSIVDAALSSSMLKLQVFLKFTCTDSVVSLPTHVPPWYSRELHFKCHPIMMSKSNKMLQFSVFCLPSPGERSVLQPSAVDT